MRKLILVAVLLVAFVALADRALTYSSTKSRTLSVTAALLPDGGCAASACGEIKQADGGTGPNTCTQAIELAGGSTAQTRCLNILNSGDALWRAQEGL